VKGRLAGAFLASFLLCSTGDAQEFFSIETKVFLKQGALTPMPTEPPQLMEVYVDSRRQDPEIFDANPDFFRFSKSLERKNFELRVEYQNFVPDTSYYLVPADRFTAADQDNILLTMLLVPRLERFKKELEEIEGIDENYPEKVRRIREARKILAKIDENDLPDLVVEYYKKRAQILFEAFRRGFPVPASESVILSEFSKEGTFDQLTLEVRREVFVAIGLGLARAEDITIPSGLGIDNESLGAVALRSFRQAIQCLIPGDSQKTYFAEPFVAAVKVATRARIAPEGLAALNSLLEFPDFADDAIATLTAEQKSIVLNTLELYGDVLGEQTRKAKTDPQKYIELMKIDEDYGPAWRRYGLHLIRFKSLYTNASGKTLDQYEFIDHYLSIIEQIKL
jgi:hypothetical protein